MEMARSHIKENPDSVTREALKWNPQGKRKRGRLGTPGGVMLRQRSHMEHLRESSQDRARWRKEIVDGLQEELRA